MWKPEHRTAAAERGCLRYPSDMSDVEWALVAPMIPPARRGGRPRDVNVLIGPLRNVYSVSDKVLTMALSGILIAGSKHYPAWLEVGVGMVAVDTLVHNYLHRTGILDRFDAAHQYGPRCYQAGYCADILQVVSRRIDVRLSS